MDAEIEVTEEMIRAGRRAIHGGKRGDVRSVYVAMEKARRGQSVPVKNETTTTSKEK